MKHLTLAPHLEVQNQDSPNRKHRLPRVPSTVGPCIAKLSQKPKHPRRLHLQPGCGFGTFLGPRSICLARQARHCTRRGGLARSGLHSQRVQGPCCKPSKILQVAYQFEQTHQYSASLFSRFDLLGPTATMTCAPEPKAEPLVQAGTHPVTGRGLQKSQHRQGGQVEAQPPG